MAGQADGSIIIDTELDSKGFEAGSAELLAAIRSLSNEVNTLGKTLREAFVSNDNGVSATDNKVQALEATIASLQAQVRSLKTTVTELQEKLNSLNNGQTAEAPVDIDVSAAEAKIASLENKIRELEDTIARLRNGGEVNATPTVNLGGAPEKASSLQRQIDSISGSVERLEPTFQRAMGGSESAMTSFEAKAGALENKIAELQSKLAAAGQAKMPTAEYQNVSDEIAKTAQKFDALLIRQEKMQAMGVKENTKQWQSLQYDMEIVSNKYHELLALKQQLETSGGAFMTGAQTAQYAQMEAGLAAANQRLAEMRAGLSQSEGAMDRVASSARSVFSWIGRAASTVAGGLVSAIKTAASNLVKMLTHSKSMKSQFGSLISSAKRFGMSLFGVRGIYMLLRKAVSAYMQQNRQLAANLSACWSGIGNILGPIITRLIGLVSTAVAYLTQFLQMLGFVGKSTSKAISNAGGGASKAANKLKRQLASFDELNVLSDDSPEGGGGAVDVSGKMPEVTMPDWVQLMVDHLKSGEWGAAATVLTDQLNGMIAGVDWAGVGDTLAYWLGGTLAFLATAITTFDWFNLGTSLGTMLNNVIYGVDWANLGIVLGWKFIALIEGLGGLFATIDWSALGKALADGFMGLWNAIDWRQAAKTLSDGIIGALTALSGAIKNVDWQKLGNDIALFIASIDWNGIFTALSDGLGAALGGLAALVWGLIEDAWASVVEWWHEVAYEDGAFTMEGLLQGIWDGICNIGQWIVKNIFDPFIKGFKDAFGISSPSKVMQKQGGFIVDGLLLGLQDAWSGLSSWVGDVFADFTSFVADWASDVTQRVSSWASNTKADIVKWVDGTKTSLATWSSATKANVSRWASDVKNEVSSWASSAKTTISAWASTTASSISSWASNMHTTIRGKVDSVKSTLSSGFDSARSSIVSNMQTAMDTIKTQNWYGIGSNICAGIKNGINNGWSTLKTTISNLAKNLLNSAKSALDIHSPSRLFRDVVGLNIGYGIGEGIEAAEGSVLGSVVGVADAIAEEFNANGYSISGVVSEANVDSALTSFSDKITNSFTGLLDRLQAIAENVTFKTPAVANGVVPYYATQTETSPGHQSASVQDAIATIMGDQTAAILAGFEASVGVQREILEAVLGIHLGDEMIGQAVNRYQQKMAVMRGG